MLPSKCGARLYSREDEFDRDVCGAIRGLDRTIDGEAHGPDAHDHQWPDGDRSSAAFERAREDEVCVVTSGIEIDNRDEVLQKLQGTLHPVQNIESGYLCWSAERTRS